MLNYKKYLLLFALSIFSFVSPCYAQANVTPSKQYFAGKFDILSKFNLSENYPQKANLLKILFGKSSTNVMLKNNDNSKKNPISWYIAGSEDDDSIILFSENPLINCKFREKVNKYQATNNYETSDLRKKVKRLSESKLKNIFTISELNMVQNSTIKTNSYTSDGNVLPYYTTEKLYVPCSKNDIKGKNYPVFVGENFDFPIDVSFIKNTSWLRSPYKYRGSDVLVVDCNEGIYDCYADNFNFSHVAFKLNISDVVFASAAPINFEGKILLDDQPLILRKKSSLKYNIKLVDNNIEVKNAIGMNLIVQWCEDNSKNFCFCKKIKNSNEILYVDELSSPNLQDFQNCKIWLEYNLDNISYVTDVINLENKIKPSFNIHFCTYGNEKFENSKVRLSQEAMATGIFKSINVFSPENLSGDFKKKYQTLLSRKKGNGFWLWKLNILKQMFEKTPKNDYVFYLDAGSTLKKEFKYQLMDWIELLENSEYKNLSLVLSNAEKEWTIKEIFTALEKTNKDYDKFKVENTNQISATCLLFKNDEHSKNILNTCFKLIDYDNNLITGDYNNIQNKYFKDSRYDQSILSCVRKSLGTTYFPNKLKKYIEFTRIRN